jgi:FAD/FMN-containing dehydrogenase
MELLAAERPVPKALEGFAGRILEPGDADYDAARRIYNALIDRRPTRIAQCQGVADIVAAVNDGRDEGLEITVRGGGHGVAGRAVSDGGLMIDLSHMKGIHVDPDQRTAIVQPGVIWRELNRETQLHGLAVTGGVVSTTGVAGLTLGGGLGWIMGLYGLALDNLRSVEVVTADGAVVRASDEEHPDLFWGLRGGSGNFGVVAEFKYRLHPVGPTVTGGQVVWPFSAAREVLRFYREFSDASPDERTTYAGLLHAPDGTNVVAIVVCHVGRQDQAERDLAPLRAFGSPVLSQVGPIPYTTFNSLLDEAYPYGSFNYWKSSVMPDLSDEAIETLIDRFEQAPAPTLSMLFEHVHGAVTRVPDAATAFPHRQPGYNFLIPSIWSDPTATDEVVRWTRETHRAMEPFVARRQYVNYLSADASDEATARAAYGPNYDRLVEVKRAWDPANVFHQNLNIPPRH